MKDCEDCSADFVYMNAGGFNFITNLDYDDLELGIICDSIVERIVRSRDYVDNDGLVDDLNDRAVDYHYEIYRVD